MPLESEREEVPLLPTPFEGHKNYPGEQSVLSSVSQHREIGLLEYQSAAQLSY